VSELSEPAVSRETRERLEAFTALLRHWNRRLNLIARLDESKLWSRHVGDSLQLAGSIGEGTQRAIDLGSGAGFPGLVLAIATGVPFSLIEADHRKAAFLEEAIRTTSAPAQVVCARVESARCAPADVVTARGFAALPRILALAERLLLPAGRVLLLKGRGVDAELAAARRDRLFRVQRMPSRTPGDGWILAIDGLQAAEPQPDPDH
jgi:16S rRNA (guanine527-N7)-methyltransferase